MTIKPTQILLFSFIALALCSCSSKGSSEGESLDSPKYPKTIDISNAEWFDGYFHELVDDIYYIELDTQTDALFGEKTKLLFSDDRIIVFDRRLQRVVVFDSNGDFLFKIHEPGDGPGQYKGLWTISYDSDFDEYILAASGKVLWFNGNGEYIREKKVPFSHLGDIASLDNQQIALYFDIYNVGDSSFRISVRDKVFEEVKAYLPLPSKILSENATGFYSHFSSGKEPLAVGVYLPEILRFAKDSVYAEFYVDFGEDGLPEDFMETYLMDESLNSQAVRDIITQRNYWSIYGGAANETADHVLFLYSNRKEYNQALYNKETGEVLTFSAYLDEPSNRNVYFYFQTSYNNYFVAQGKSSFLLELYGLLKPNEDVEAVQEAIENEVPVLWFIKFKSQME